MEFSWSAKEKKDYSGNCCFVSVAGVFMLMLKSGCARVRERMIRVRVSPGSLLKIYLFPLVQDCRGYEAMKKVAVVTHKYKVDLMESPSHEQSLIT